MPARPSKLESNLKKLHHLLGLAVLPWLIALGLGGLVVNHAPAVQALLPYGKPADLAVVDNWPDPQPVSATTAGTIARRTWPDGLYEAARKGVFRGQPVFRVSSDQGEVIVLRDTGFYWVQTRFWRVFHDPAGHELNRSFRWGTGHGHGRSAALGAGMDANQTIEVLADIASVLLVLFGASGLALALGPHRRRRRPRHHEARAIPSFPSSRST